MKKTKRWLLMTVALLMLVTHAVAVAPFKKVALATTTKSTTTTTTTTTTSTTEAPSTEADDGKSSSSSGPTKNSKLTGIPQIDYIWDPNLPRELRGYNLSSYPFFATTPPEEDIHFKCDGLHDGFYASIEHKCQVYHHCVYGIRHDFLCANFTAFDQKTFICHFVSDVDCEGSQKYWNRNDNLYMATTTTTTTTTTTEPPPTPRRRPVRPLRPLRRPQRPVDDYYYDEAQEYDDDYYEEQAARRRKHRPRHRKPSVDDYEDDYYEKRRRPNSRDRFRDEDEPEEDYDNDRRKYDRPKSRNSKPERNGNDDRRKPSSRKPGVFAGRTDERRSFSEDRPVNGRKDNRNRPAVSDSEEPIEPKPQRRLAGRRRINEKRTSPAVNDPAEADDYEQKSKPHPLDQEEAAEEEAPNKVKTTPKPLEEFITPKAAPASVYSRPRAPPRIARPVPVNEKKKYQYPVQKTATTTSSPGDTHADDADYYEDEEYEDARAPPQRPHNRRRIPDESEDEAAAPGPAKRRNHNEAPGRKPTRATLRKPVTEKKPLPADDPSSDYDSSVSDPHERYDSRAPPRRRPYASRTRGSARDTDDMDFVDDDYDERPAPRPGSRLRPKVAARKSLKKPRPLENDEEADVDAYESEPEPELPSRSRSPSSSSGRRRPVAARPRQPAPHDETPPEAEDESDNDDNVELPPNKAGRTATVRVVKRPFLPSRGGSPYLPRGLQPVGVALKPLGTRAGHTTDSTPIDMGSTISGVRLLEHGAPILRDSGSERVPALPAGLRTTLPPRSPIPVVQTRPETVVQQPKITLDELYENDYDVTLNDALNPTLKPLSSHHRSYGVATVRDAAAPPASSAIAYATAPVVTGISDGARSLRRRLPVPVKRTTEASAQE